MKYSLVRIGRDLEGKIEVSFYDDEQERVEEKTYPHSSGFYYFPTNKGHKYGFDILKKHLIEESNKLIKSAENFIKEIEDIEIKE